MQCNRIGKVDLLLINNYISSDAVAEPSVLSQVSVDLGDCATHSESLRDERKDHHT